MADFPGGMPTFTAPPAAGTPLGTSSGGLTQRTRHTKITDELAAVLAKVGTDGSADPASHDFLIAALTTAVALKAALASPAFTGNPTATTQATSDDSTRLATTAFVHAVVNALIASAPGALNTLDELAAALGDDANFAATVATALTTLGNRATALETEEAVNALTIVSGAVNIDCALGRYFTLSLTANVTSITFSNLPASGRARSLWVTIKQDATGGRTVAFPSSFDWAGGTIGVVSSAANAKDNLALTTTDQGTSWEATLSKAHA